MKPTIALIDSVLVSKGKMALADMEKSSMSPRKANEALLLHIRNKNANTECGRKYGFADIYSAEEYKRKIPLSGYDVYYPYIRRMVLDKEINLILHKKPPGRHNHITAI